MVDMGPGDHGQGWLSGQGLGSQHTLGVRAAQREKKDGIAPSSGLRHHTPPHPTLTPKLTAWV